MDSPGSWGAGWCDESPATGYRGTRGCRVGCSSAQHGVWHTVCLPLMLDKAPSRRSVITSPYACTEITDREYISGYSFRNIRRAIFTLLVREFAYSFPKPAFTGCRRFPGSHFVVHRFLLSILENFCFLLIFIVIPAHFLRNTTCRVYRLRFERHHVHSTKPNGASWHAFCGCRPP